VGTKGHITYQEKLTHGWPLRTPGHEGGTITGSNAEGVGVNTEEPNSGTKKKKEWVGTTGRKKKRPIGVP